VSMARASAAPRIDMNELEAALRAGGDPPPRQKNAKVRMFYWASLWSSWLVYAFWVE
jgi:hypothetical protein